MKKVIKSLAMSALAVMMMTTITIAQEKAIKGRDKHKSSLNLNEEQKALMKENAESMKAARASLEATFTDAQKNILANKEITAMERRKALEATFTAEQKAISDKNKALAKEGKEKFQQSLTEEQKAAYKNRMGRERGPRQPK